MCSWILKMPSAGESCTYLGRLFSARLFSLWKILCPIGIFLGVTCARHLSYFPCDSSWKGSYPSLYMQEHGDKVFPSFSLWRLNKPSPLRLSSQPSSGLVISVVLLWTLSSPYPSFCIVGTKTEQSIPGVAWEALSRAAQWFLSPCWWCPRGCYPASFLCCSSKLFTRVELVVH